MAKVVLVTGCRSGFGLLVAVAAANRGHVVYAGLRDVATCGDLDAAAAGLPITPVQLDVTSPSDREAVVARITAEHGRIDALVNNAGSPLGGVLEEIEEDELRALFDVNVLAPWALTKAVLPWMRAQGAGTVINVSSSSGRFALPGLGAYAASKFALEGLSESWRHELAPFGVSVVLVEPGPFKTDIFDRNRRVGRGTGRPDSPYAAFTTKLEGLAAKAAGMAGDPSAVADRIVSLIEADRPALRHPLGPWVRTRLWGKDLLPFRAIEWAIGRALR